MTVRRIGVEACFDGVALHADGPYLITVADGVIASIAPVEATESADLCAPFAMPGLCDAHVHLFLDGSRLDPAQRNAQVGSGLPVMLSVARANIDNSLRAGVTLLRDAGDAFGINHAMRRDLGARTDSMVALRSSGAGLRRAGRYGRLLAGEIGDACNISQAVDAAAESADDIKVILTDIVDFETRRMKGPPQFDLDEMRLIVARARRHGRRTFVHCSGADGLAIAVAAKVDSIEHGYFMNREILKQMADAQIAWVPTFAPVCFQLARPEIAGWSRTAIANLDRILGSHAEHVALAYELGVPIIAGSDAGSPGVPHGSGLIDELHHMCEAGLPLAAVIRSATGEARRHWGMPAASIGPGQQADIVLLETSPFRNPGALREVLAVVRGDIVFHATDCDPAPRYPVSHAGHRGTRRIIRMSRNVKPPQTGRRSRERPRASAHALDLDSYIPAYLSFLAGKLSSGASAVYRPRFGIGITDWRMMALLAAEPWVVASHICNSTGLDKAAASRSVRSLQELGLIDIAPDSQDQRKQLIALTSKGVALHDRIVELAVAREQALLEGLSEAERTTLLRLLIHLQRRMRAVNGVGATRRRVAKPSST